jgi:hypothetical protein
MTWLDYEKLIKLALRGIAMIRRFMNIVAEDYKTGL